MPPSVRARAQEGGSIWLHAGFGSGEVIAGVPLARALKQRFPNRPLMISTTTQTGQKVARERLDFADAVFSIFRSIGPGWSSASSGRFGRRVLLF